MFLLNPEKLCCHLNLTEKIPKNLAKMEHHGIDDVPLEISPIALRLYGKFAHFLMKLKTS